MIYPKCKNIVEENPGNAMGIRSCGHVIPCCFFGSERAWNHLKDLLGNDISNLHISTGKTLDEFNKSKEFQRIEETWSTDNPLATCVGSCGNKADIGDKDKTSTGSEHTQNTLTDDERR